MVVSGDGQKPYYKNPHYYPNVESSFGFLLSDLFLRQREVIFGLLPKLQVRITIISIWIRIRICMLVVAIITTRYVHDSTHHGSNPSAHILSDKMGGLLQRLQRWEITYIILLLGT